MLEAHDLLVAGHYRLLHRLRRGGMSEVFLALDEQTQQQVALKLVSSTSADDFQRLKREVRVLGRLSHQHILPILDDGEWEGYAYLVMPYMKHGSLREHLAHGPLSQEEAGTILSQVAAALQCAHDHGILHRDIKASNILLEHHTPDAVYLADFGLAKAPGESGAITQTGDLIGTPEYMAPELATMPESAGSDLYALGILLYQMLTGRFPFTGPSPLAICWKHVHDMPPRPSSHNPAISPAVEAVILRAIDKDPARRFPGAQLLAEAYQQALRSSSQTPFAASRPLPPGQVTVSRLALHPTRSIALTGADRAHRARSIKRKSLLTAVALLWLGTALSLGFIVGHAGSLAALVAKSNVQSVEKALQPIAPSRVGPPVKPGPPATLPPAPKQALAISHTHSTTSSAPPTEYSKPTGHTKPTRHSKPARHPRDEKHHHKHGDG